MASGGGGSGAPYYAVRCTNVPEDFFFDKVAAKAYFRTFGRLKLVRFRPKSHEVVVEYHTPAGLYCALQKAGNYNGYIFSVCRGAAVGQPTPEKKKRKKSTSRTGNNDDDWTTDPEIQAELKAMGAFEPMRKYNLRQQAMIVDPKPPDQSSALDKPKRVRRVLESKEEMCQPVKKSKTTDNLDAELVHIVLSQAHSMEDRLRILDARDKLLRKRFQQQQRSTDGIVGEATVGTCPDMCSEKERIMRHTQHQVALLEQATDGSLDHRLAIKQYSRSSADQEFPLPGELRPVPVLHMTMTYLLHRIMDLCNSSDVNLGDWYHFIWDRTRSIRKDITQQALCCQGSVTLVEQCARFHIFCSARLVAEDTSVFDEKINTENLTKCLQTLKYMYADLELRGEQCPNEAEFRGYVILLNLNDSNFMWEIQHLKANIRRSTPVQFALAAYTALERNNFVRFFKLVRRPDCTLLQASILMRYFMQVRIRALDILMRCYSARTTIEVLLLCELLGFETSEAALEFVQARGLYITLESNGATLIQLDRKSYVSGATIVEDLQLMPTASGLNSLKLTGRALNLVESKQIGWNVGQVVNGAQHLPSLDVYNQHTPADSFDAIGYLKDRQQWESEYQENRKGAQVTTASPPFSIDFDLTRTDNDNDQEKEGMRIRQELIAQQEEKRRHMATAMAQAKMWMEQQKIRQQQQQQKTEEAKQAEMQRIQRLRLKEQENEQLKVRQRVEADKERQLQQLKRQLDEMERQRRIKEQEAIDRQRHLEEMERQKRREKEEQEEQKRLLKIEWQKRLEEIEKQRRLQAEEQQRQQRLEQERIESQKQLQLKQAVQCLLVDVVDNVAQQLCIEQLHNRRRIRLMRNAWQQWRSNVRALCHQRHLEQLSRLGTSIGIPYNSIECAAAQLRIPQIKETLANRQRYQCGYAVDLHPPEEPLHAPIDFVKIAYQLILASCGTPVTGDEHIYWKMNVCSRQSGAFGALTERIARYFHIALSLERNVYVQCYKHVTFGVELIPEAEQSMQTCNHANGGWLFIAPDFDMELQHTIERYLRKPHTSMTCPVVVILHRYTQHKHNLERLKTIGAINEWIVMDELNMHQHLETVLSDGVAFLARNSVHTRMPPLRLNLVRHLVAKVCIDELSMRIASLLDTQESYAHALSDLSVVIALFNDSLCRLQDMTTSASLGEYSCSFPDFVFGKPQRVTAVQLPCDYRFFPPKWNEQNHLQRIRKIIEAMKLSTKLPFDVASKLAWTQYCDNDEVVLKVMSIVWQHLAAAPTTNLVRARCWIDVVVTMLMDRLESLNWEHHSNDADEDNEAFTELYMVYNLHSMKAFQSERWFNGQHAAVRARMTTPDGTTRSVRGEKPTENDYNISASEMQKIDKLLEHFLTASDPQKPPPSVQMDIEYCQALAADLENAMSIHRAIVESTDKMLQHIDG